MLCEKTLATLDWGLFVFFCLCFSFYLRGILWFRSKATARQPGHRTREKKGGITRFGLRFDPCHCTINHTKPRSCVRPRKAVRQRRQCQYRNPIQRYLLIPEQGRPRCKTGPSVTGNPGKGERSRERWRGRAWVWDPSRAPHPGQSTRTGSSGFDTDCDHDRWNCRKLLFT